MCKLFKLFFAVTVFVSSFQFGPAYAATVGFTGVPTAWRVESYGEKGVVLWFTQSKCTNGVVNLPSTATTVDHNRFYATIMAAKIAQTPVFIYYDDATPTCTVISYGLMQNGFVA